MKSIRRMLAVILSLAMVLGTMTVTSFAEALEEDSSETEIIKYASITIETDLTLHISVDMPEDALIHMTFERNGSEQIVYGQYDSAKNLWQFDYTGIYGQCMSDQIVMKVLCDDKVIDEKTYSVREYCDSLFAYGPAEISFGTKKMNLTRRLMADMLNYGANVQRYINYKTSDLANNLEWIPQYCSSKFAVPKSNYSILIANSDNSEKINNASLYLDNEIKFKLKVSANEADSIFVEGVDESYHIDISDFELIDGYYFVETKPIDISKIGDIFTFSLIDDKNTYHKITYSVNSYIHNMYKKDNSVLDDLIKTIYFFGKSAEEYVSCNNDEEDTQTQTHKVTFVDYNNQIVGEQAVLASEVVNLPTATTKPNADFMGWSGNYVDVEKDEIVKAVYSDDNNVFVCQSKTGAVGREVTILLEITGDVKTCGFDITVDYSPYLELVTYDDDLDLDIVSNSDKNNNKIYLNFSGSSEKTKPREIVEMTFKIKETSKKALPVRVVLNSIKELSEDRILNAKNSIVDGVVYIK